MMESIYAKSDDGPGIKKKNGWWLIKLEKCGETIHVKRQIIIIIIRFYVYGYQIE